MFLASGRQMSKKDQNPVTGWQHQEHGARETEELAASVQVEHVRKLRKLDQKLYGTDIDSASPPGPALLRRFHALGEVHPIVFGAYGRQPVEQGEPRGGNERIASKSYVWRN
jgi:hypothetical protein